MKIPTYTSKKGTVWCMPADTHRFTREEQAVLDKNGFSIWMTDRRDERASAFKPPVATGHIE
jgi:hypothetical protein